MEGNLLEYLIDILYVCYSNNVCKIAVQFFADGILIQHLIGYISKAWVLEPEKCVRLKHFADVFSGNK